MDTVNIKVNGKEITVPVNSTVLDAAEELGINIPRLCFLKDINETSACRLCVVDVKNMRGLKNSCTLAVYDGMEVETDNDDIRDAVVENLKLLASNHVFECWACEREHNCELLDLMRRFNVENVYGERFDYDKKGRMINDSSPAIVLDSGKCILCGRCVSACEVHTGLGILQFNQRGNSTYVGPANFHPMEDSGCINCGKCIQACPVAAIKEQNHIDGVFDALKNPYKTVVAVPHPSVAVSLGEEFGTDIGTNVEGKLFAALKSLGFDDIMNYGYASDLAILEEASVLINRLKSHEEDPLLTSCAPGWIDYIEQYEPDYLASLSGVKSPQQIAGSLVKHHFANQVGYQRENIVVVAVSPAIDKKAEAARDTMVYNGVKDVDYVLTTKELARMLKRTGKELLRFQDEEPFGPLAELTDVKHSNHYVNGVLEPTLATVSNLLQEEPQELKFKSARGMKSIKEATYKISGKDINVAIVHGEMTFQEFFAHMNKTKKEYHYVEFIEQPGCMIGGGEPIHSAVVEDRTPIQELRFEALNALYTDRPNKANEAKAVHSLIQDEEVPTLTSNLVLTSYQANEFYK